MHGIVAVHGIGEGQRKGAFLASLVNAVADYLEEVGGKVERRFQVGEQATAYLAVTAPQGGVEEFTFLEAYWADAFPPPRAGAVLGWLWPHLWGQFMLLLRAWQDAANDTSFDPAGPRAPDTPTFPFWVRMAYVAWFATLFLLLVPAALLAVASLGVFQILLWLPLPHVLGQFGLLGRALALIYALDPFLTRILGDTHRYINDGAWAANIRGILERCVVELVRRPEVSDITIIAHSQGCAIAYDALAEGSPVGAALAQNPKRITLVTLGSGVNRIFALAQNSSPYARRRFSLPLDPAVTGAGQRLTLEGLRRRFFWLDIYARFDPVPAGPLQERIIQQAGLDPGQVKRRRVINADNPITDHSLYLENRDLVLPRLVRAMYGGDYPWPEATGISPQRVRRRTIALALLHLPAVVWFWGTVGLALALVFWGAVRAGFLGVLGPVVVGMPWLGPAYAGLATALHKALLLAILVAGAGGVVVVLVGQALRRILGPLRL